MKRAGAKFLLLAVSILLTLAALELALRLVVGPSERGRELQGMLNASRDATPAGGVAGVSLRGLVQSSQNDRLVYELKPGLKAKFLGVPIEVNDAGFRERDVPQKKPKGTFRIVGLGDSVMFGWGVPVEATYLRVLENRLQAHGDPVRYETLNFAVPGYNAAMEVESFLSIAHRYEPDLVIVGLVWNDADVPNFMKQSSLEWPDTSYLYSLIVHGAGAMRSRARELLTTRYDAKSRRMEPVAGMEGPFREMVGVEGVRRAYAQLGQAANERKISVVVFGDYRTLLDPSDVASLQGAGSLVFKESDSESYERLHGITIKPADVVHDAKKDDHPNVLGHAVMAESLYRTLVDQGLIPGHGPGKQRN